MRVLKNEVAEAIKHRMREFGAISQPQMVKVLRQKGLAISQPTISRALTGEYEGVPPSLEEICTHSDISLNKFLVQVDPSSSERLMDALRLVWDGSPQTETFLVRVIKAAGKLVKAK